MNTDLTALAELLALVCFYRRHHQQDVAIQLLTDIVHLDNSMERTERERLRAVVLYNLAELYSESPNCALIAQELYQEAASIWNDIQPGNPLSMLWFSDALQKLQEETDRLILLGHRQQEEEIRHDAA